MRTRFVTAIKKKNGVAFITWFNHMQVCICIAYSEHSFILVFLCVLVPLQANISTWAALVKGSVFTVPSPGCIHIHEHTHTKKSPDRARSEIWPCLWAAAHRGSSPRANEGGSKSTLPCLPSSSRSVSTPLTSNKRPAGLSLCLLGSDNRTCPEPKEMNYLPCTLLYSWKKIKSLLYCQWTHSPCTAHTPCSVALDVKCSEKFSFPTVSEDIIPGLAAKQHTRTCVCSRLLLIYKTAKLPDIK